MFHTIWLYLPTACLTEHSFTSTTTTCLTPLLSSAPQRHISHCLVLAAYSDMSHIGTLTTNITVHSVTNTVTTYTTSRVSSFTTIYIHQPATPLLTDLTVSVKPPPRGKMLLSRKSHLTAAENHSFAIEVRVELPSGKAVSALLSPANLCWDMNVDRPKTRSWYMLAHRAGLTQLYLS